MRIMLIVLCGVVMAAAARGQTSGDVRIDITSYGIMSGPAGIADGTSSGGIEHRLSGASRVLQQTTRIPACLGVRFGLSFNLAGRAGTPPPDIVETYRFPPPGLRKPDSAVALHETRYTQTTNGSGGQVWYEFDDPWELLPGDWTLELQVGNRVMASKVFTVVPPGPRQCPKLSA